MNLENLKIWFTNLSQPHLFKMAVVLGLSLSLAVTVLLWLNKTESALLISGLSGSELAEVTAIIERNAISPQIEPSSGSIMVPPDAVYEMRLKIAAAGYPKKPVEGYGLFDQQQSGGVLSRKDDDLMRRRILEGELARSILTIQGIENARVHLVIGAKNGLLRDKVESKASVVIKSQHSFTLSQEQVVAIIHMVATSVQGLDADKISVIDHKGRLLSLNQSSEKHLANKNLNYKQKLEQILTKRVEDILGVVMGVENVKAQVHASIDFSRRTEKAESYDPASQVVRSQQTEQTNQSGGGSAAGGAANNLEGSATGGSKSKSEKQTSVINYEVDKLISTREYGGGVIERLTVSIVVNDHQVFNEETNAMEYQPLSVDEVSRFTELAKASVGFDQARGDQIVLINTSFERPSFAIDMPVATPDDWLDLATPYIKYLLAFLLLLATYLFMLRPLIRDISKATPTAALAEASTQAEQTSTITDNTAHNRVTVDDDISPVKSYEDLHGELMSAVAKDTNLTAAVVKEWLNSEVIDVLINDDSLLFDAPMNDADAAGQRS